MSPHVMVIGGDVTLCPPAANGRRITEPRPWRHRHEPLRVLAEVDGEVVAALAGGLELVGVRLERVVDVVQTPDLTGLQVVPDELVEEPLVAPLDSLSMGNQ